MEAKKMTSEDFDILNRLLDEVMKLAPCKGGRCVGHMNCEFGENGCYGESCAIEDVQAALYTVKS